MMLKYFLSTLFFLACTCYAFAQSSLLQAGPMPTHATMRSASVWLQTKASAQVYIEYKPTAEVKSNWKKTAAVSTIENNGYTALLKVNLLEPGVTYDYRVYINEKLVALPYALQFKTPPLWQYRTDPPDMTIALGSCSYVNEEAYDRPNNAYGSNYGIYKAMAAEKPDLMLWLGDNTYYREADFDNRASLIYRNTHTRGIQELQPFLAATSHYAIWDDHDYGPNDSDRTYIHKETTQDIFQLFWGNPSYGLPGKKGITSYFSWGDCDFFMMDNRYFRSPNDCKTCKQEILGEDQLNWLVEALVSSHAKFKFVMIGGMFLSTYEGYENHNNYFKEERAALLSRIEAESIKNVVFLTGDRHHTEFSQWTTNQGWKVHDFTVSPLTSGAATKTDKEVNRLRVEGSDVWEHNYGIIRVKGPRKKRVMHLEVHNALGEVVWRFQVPEEW